MRPWRRARRRPRSTRDVSDCDLELGAEPGERVDRVLLHPEVDLVRAEAGTLEEARQPANRVRAHLDEVEDAREVLDRRLESLARHAPRGEGLLHPRVGADDRLSRIRLAAEVVES